MTAPDGFGLYDSFMEELKPPERSGGDPLEPLLFGDLRYARERGLHGEEVLPTSAAMSQVSTDPTEDVLRTFYELPTTASSASDRGTVLFEDAVVPSMEGFQVPSLDAQPETISPEMLTLDPLAGPARRGSRSTRRVKAESLGETTPTSSDGSSFSPDFLTEDKPASRSKPSKARSTIAPIPCQSATPTATSRRDETDTFHRYVSAQLRKGRDFSAVAAEGRAKANEKRDKNRDYARTRLATGKARTTELEGLVVSLKAGNDVLASEVRGLEEELTAMGGHLAEQAE